MVTSHQAASLATREDHQPRCSHQVSQVASTVSRISQEHHWPLVQHLLDKVLFHHSQYLVTVFLSFQAVLLKDIQMCLKEDHYPGIRYKKARNWGIQELKCPTSQMMMTVISRQSLRGVQSTVQQEVGRMTGSQTKVRHYPFIVHVCFLANLCLYFCDRIVKSINHCCYFP